MKKYLCISILLPILVFLLLRSRSRGEADSFSRLMSTNRKFVLVWEDNRNGNDADIYCGIYNYSTGSLVNPIFRVNSDTGSSAQNTPAVAMDSIGNFVVVWSDCRYGLSEIYGQLYDANGVRIGTNFIVSNDTADAYNQCEPAIARAKNGNFIVAWRDDRNYYVKSLDIYAQLFDQNGNKIGEHFIVNDDAQKLTQRTPEIAFYTREDFAIVWMDGRRGEPDIYCQRYNLSGSLIGNNFRVNDDNIVNSQQWFPFISSNYDRTVIIWRDNRLSTYPNIFAQIYDSLWNPVDSNFCVNPGRKLCSQGVAKVTYCVTNKMNEFIVVWNDETTAIRYPDVYFQKFDATGVPIGDTVRVNDTLSDGLNSTTPKIIIDENGNFIIIWQHIFTSSPDTNIMMQSYDVNNNPIGKNIMIVPDRGTGNQMESSISINEKTDFVIVWLDKITGGIFGKVYNKAGNPYRASFRISPVFATPYTTRGSQPTVAIDTNGNFVTVWISDERTHIYGCKYNLAQESSSSVFKVDSGAAQWSQTISPDIAMDKNGNFVVVWEDYRLDNKFPDIFCQRFTKDCIPIDTNFCVNDNLGQRSQLPCVAMNKTGSPDNGEFIVVWQEDVNDMVCFDIEGQKYDSLGNPVGGNFKISEDAVGNIKQKNSSIAIRENGTFIVVWEDLRNGNSDIYGQVCDSLCELIGNNFKITNTTDNSSNMYPSIAGKSNFVVSWTSYGSLNPQIMVQLFDSLGQSEGENFQLNNADAYTSNQHWSSSKHSVTANNEFFAFTWVDNRRLKGWDIYAEFVRQTIEWSIVKNDFLVNDDTTGGCDQMHPDIAGPVEIEDTLSHKTYIKAYPNPVYNKLTIEYEITRNGAYTIEIYDRTGRKILSLPEGEKTIGKYTIELDLSKYSSGVYFIKLKGQESSSINKVIYIK